jgi:hypothetical protein
MGLSTSTTIFLFLVCLCGGIAIGAMFSRIKKSSPEPEKDRKDANGEAPSDVASLAHKEDLEILRAWRDGTGQPWLEMDGERLEGKTTLKTVQKKKLAKLLADLRPWVEEAPAVVAPEAASAAVPVAPAETPQAKPVEIANRASIFSPRPREALKPVLMVDEKPKVSLKSIVEQIDDVLQNKLEGTAFASQGIKLLEGPGGTVMVQIGAQKYEGVGTVPDPQVQALVREAVAEWDKSQ